jgi:hypothetical protein
MPLPHKMTTTTTSRCITADERGANHAPSAFFFDNPNRNLAAKKKIGGLDMFYKLANKVCRDET